VHLIVSKLDLWSANQVRGVLYKEEVAEAFQFWLDDSHRFDSHKNSSLTEKSALDIIHKHQKFHFQYNLQGNNDYQPNKAIISNRLSINETDKKNNQYLKEMHDEFLIYQKKQKKIRLKNKLFLATQSLKNRLNKAVACNESLEEIQRCINNIDVEEAIQFAANNFGLDAKYFEIVENKGKRVALDARSGQTFNSFGIAHEHLNLTISESIRWLHGCISVFNSPEN